MSFEKLTGMTREEYRAWVDEEAAERFAARGYRLRLLLDESVVATDESGKGRNLVFQPPEILFVVKLMKDFEALMSELKATFYLQPSEKLFVAELMDEVETLKRSLKRRMDQTLDEKRAGK
jgi:hypothetical protein